MYRVIAERIDAKTRQTLYTHTAIVESFEPFVDDVQGRGSLKCMTPNGPVSFAVGNTDEDFQLVRVFDGDGSMIGSASYNVASNSAMWVRGEVASR
jgi:hypothetical protein